MNFEERNYAGRGRPLPVMELDPDNKLLLICTPWGPRSRSKTVMSIFKDQFLSGQVDPEVTMPFDRLTCLSQTANDLRIAMKVCNDGIYYSDNRENYSFAAEFLALSIGEKELAFAAVGGPFLFIQRKEAPLMPLNVHTDMAIEYSSKAQLFAALPSELLGVESTSSVLVKSTRIARGDKLIMVSRAYIPPEFYRYCDSNFNIDELSQFLTAEDPNQSYWLASLSL